MTTLADQDTMTPTAVEAGLERLQLLTRSIADHQAAMVRSGQERRDLMLRLNRTGSVSYRRIAEVVGLATSRVITELHRAREEAGILDEPHPGWNRQANGES